MRLRRTAKENKNDVKRGELNCPNMIDRRTKKLVVV